MDPTSTWPPSTSSQSALPSTLSSTSTREPGTSSNPSIPWGSSSQSKQSFSSPFGKQQVCHVRKVLEKMKLKIFPQAVSPDSLAGEAESAPSLMEAVRYGKRGSGAPELPHLCGDVGGCLCTLLYLFPQTLRRPCCC